MEQSPTSATGTAWERTPWHATQRAAWGRITGQSQVLHPWKALLSGLVAGVLALGLGGYFLWLGAAGIWTDLVLIVLPLVVAPLTAAVSAIAMQARSGRALALAGLAFLLQYTITNVMDYALTALLLMPNAPGPYQGKTDLSEAEVAHIADVWAATLQPGSQDFSVEAS